eukprot:8987174-Prorocentrum_lima.AAC.1
MTSSLVGSEMCIRDRSKTPGGCVALHRCAPAAGAAAYRFTHAAPATPVPAAFDLSLIHI